VSEPDSQSPPTDPESPPTDPESPPPDHRYAQLAVGDQVVVYDRHNHRAWVQSDAAVSAESMA
jgi:hypothetical protein